MTRNQPEPATIAFPPPAATQIPLFCPCGRRPVELPSQACCRLCYYASYDSARRFAGHRAAVLARDGWQCRACGARERLVVHHRRPGDHSPERLVSLCARCHVRIHHAKRFRAFLPERVLEFWREVHPGSPLQLQLPLQEAA